MRKILLATTALVAFAGAAQAAESPIQVTVGGFVDFRAALFHESEMSKATSNGERRGGDFATEYNLNVGAEGKAANGIVYGAQIALNNRANPSDGIGMDQAYIYMSGAWGKVIMGDAHGATDLFVIAPTVGEGQIDGNYTNFTDSTTLAQFQPAYIDTLENSTKVVYYTPKVGNANHKVQLGVSYTPNAGDKGLNVVKYDAASGYQNQIEGTMQYTGNFSPVSVVVAPIVATGEGQGNKRTSQSRDYTLWGVGAQAAYAGFTFGGSYIDAGKMGTSIGQNKEQNVWTAGLKYEFDKVAVAANYMDGEGYYTLNGASSGAYVDDFSAIGLGATYTWFPGLTSAADAVFFDQNRADTGHNNVGHVLMLSQKMTF